jgi:hypothetical protein
MSSKQQRLKFYQKFIDTVGNHPNMTNSSVQDIWTFFLDNAEEMSRLKKLDILHSSIKTVKKFVFQKCMLKNITANVKTLTNTGNTLYYSNLKEISPTLFMNKNETIIFTQHFVPLCDIITLHRLHHKNDSLDLKSCDISIGMDSL